jgi:hypothetical protein
MAWAAEHALPQAPQFVALVIVSTQLAPHIVPMHPAAQTGAPFPLLQIGVAPPHAVVHAPQCIESVSAVSQPLLASPSQSPHDASHVKPHTPAEHVATEACAAAGHSVVHAPQWCGSDIVFAQRPLHIVVHASGAGESTDASPSWAPSRGLTWSQS